MNQHKSGTRADGGGLWDWNLVSNRIHFSPRWISLVGCTDHEVGNTPDEWFQRVHPEDLPQLSHEIETLRAQGGSEFEFRHRLRHKDGTYRWTSCRGGVTRGEDGGATRLRGSHSDVTASTVTDSLTGLPNRLLLVDRLTRAIQQANQNQGFTFALLVLDLGRSTSSAVSGFSARDPLLTAAARRLESSVRHETSTGVSHRGLVARLERDQFAILFEGLREVSEAKVAADRVLEQMLASFNLNGGEIFLSVSAGVAVSATGYARAEDVLHDAETALHRAQALGGSICEMFDTAILKSAQDELELENDLSAALARGEFRLFYQPIVSLDSNEIGGFEALVRWEHQALGMIPPQEFIAMAERSGFIMPLGQWILRTACLQLKAWHERFPERANLRVSVNLSPLQLKDPALFDQVGEALGESGIEPQCLVLELTEGTAMENPTAVRSLLMRLRAMGVRISIDDFGTGYSSLSHLRQFPVDTLKVDQSFVRGMETHTDKADIIATLTTMSQQLGLHIVAEGIENETQAAMLRSLSCDSAQGHLFGKPLDVSGATDLLTTRIAQSPSPAADAAAFASMAIWGRFRTWLGGNGWSLTSRSVSITAAVLILLTAGVAHFANRPLGMARVEPAPVADASPQREPTQLADASTPDRRKPAAAPRAVSKTGESVATTAPITRLPTSPPTAMAAPAANPAPPVVPSSMSMDVVHLHRVGNCAGRLIASPEGVSFVPAETTGRDGFTLKPQDFVQTMDDKTLTIKTSGRTYRFRAAKLDGQGDQGFRLQEFFDSAAQLH